MRRAPSLVGFLLGLALAALAHAQPALTATVSSSCDTDASALKLAPASLPPALAARYPNGVEMRLNATIDGSGTLSNVTSTVDTAGVSKADTVNLRAMVAAWARGAQYMPATKGCKPVASDLKYFDVDFYPPSSGVVGFPQVAGGVNFGNLTYTDGPGNCKTSQMRGGAYDYPEGEYSASVSDVFAGRVAGTPVAVVILRCEYNGHGFDSVAQLFATTGGAARRLSIIGSGGMTGPDSPLPPWPGGWIHVSFSGGKLYADVWDYAKQCDRNGDWVSSAYTIRGGKLVLLNQLRHHRQGLDLACER